MNKKGFEISWRVLMEAILAFVVVVSLVVLATRIYRVTNPQPDAETLNNFKRLAGEINDLISTDIEKQGKERAEGVIPLFIKEGYYVMYYNEKNDKGSLPRLCKKESCICLWSAKEDIKRYCEQTKDVYIMGPTQPFDSFPVIMHDEKRPSKIIYVRVIITTNKISGRGLYRLEATIEEKEKES